MSEEKEFDEEIEEPETFDSVRKNVSETNEPIELKWKTKRGNGTRDQDEFHAKVRGDDAQEVVAEMSALMEGVITDQAGLMSAARRLQPEVDKDE